MEKEKSDKLRKCAIAGGVVLTLGLVFSMRDNGEKKQLMLERQQQEMYNRHTRSLRRQEFIHRIIYKIFRIEY